MDFPTGTATFTVLIHGHTSLNLHGESMGVPFSRSVAPLAMKRKKGPWPELAGTCLERVE